MKLKLKRMILLGRIAMNVILLEMLCYCMIQAYLNRNVPPDFSGRYPREAHEQFMMTLECWEHGGFRM